MLISSPLPGNKDKLNTWFKGLEKNCYSLYLHGLKEVEFSNLVEFYKMKLREQDDPSDLSADP